MPDLPPAANSDTEEDQPKRKAANQGTPLRMAAKVADPLGDKKRHVKSDGVGFASANYDVESPGPDDEPYCPDDEEPRDSDDEKKLPAKAKGALKDDRSDSDEDFDESTDAVSVTQLPELVRIPMPFSHSSNVIHQFASQHYLLNRKMPEFEAYLAEESLLL